MFTGLIAAVGRIQKKQPHGDDFALSIDVGELDMADVQLGDSIAVNGVCLTVVAFDQRHFVADVSKETLEKSALAHLAIGTRVNLEKALTLSTRLGGHLVSGHVDAVGQVMRIEDNGRAKDYWIKVPDELSRYIAEKGSITIDGISLTVNAVTGNQFKLTIIPHTAEKTTLQDYQPGHQVNIEVDLIARYLERLMGQDNADKPGVTMAMLARSGFIK